MTTPDLRTEATRIADWLARMAETLGGGDQADTYGRIEKRIRTALEATRPTAEPTTERDWHTDDVTQAVSDLLVDWTAQFEPDPPGSVAREILGLLGWPHTYQPNNPHVLEACQARAELERLREGLLAQGVDLDDDALPVVDRALRVLAIRAELLDSQSAQLDQVVRLHVERDEAVTELRRLRAGIETARDALDNMLNHAQRRCAMADTILRALLADSPETAPNASEGGHA